MSSRIHAEPPEPHQGSNDDRPPRDEDDPRDRKTDEANGGTKMEPLTFRRLKEIFGMEFDDADFVLRNGYLTKGEPIVIFGAGGIGKTRLVLQLIRDILTERPFLGRWQTNGRDLKILVLQTENTNRRLKSDLWAQCSELTDEETDHIHEHCVFHTLENSDDSFLTLELAENQQRIDASIALYKPDIIVWDVLRDFAVDDPNSDRDMQATLSVIGRLTRKYNPKCIAVIIAHARTGRAGSASATGFDRGSFGRNSKVLNSWARSQINAAAYTSLDNKTLIIASGKCNNAEEFKPFAVTLNLQTMSYEVDETVTEEDIEEWHESMGLSIGVKKKKKPEKKSPEEIKEAIMKNVPDFGTILKCEVAATTYADGDLSRDDVRDYIKILVREKRLFEHHVKPEEGKGRPQSHVSRHEKIAPKEASNQQETTQENRA